MSTHSARYIANRIRLMIATKQFQVGETLPSTRELGKQLQASFHTVRKAYHTLVEEGLIESVQGRGFVVTRQMTQLDKSQRLDVGSERMRELLEELIGYGLNEEEVQTIFDEQSSYLEWPERYQNCATLAESTEIGRMLSIAIFEQVGVKSDVLNIENRSEMVNYDAFFVPVQLLSEYKSMQYDNDESRVIPVIYGIEPDSLLTIVDRASVETIGLVTKTEDSIPKLINDLKLQMHFSASILAGTIYGKSLPLFVRDTEFILYTADSASIVEAKMPEKRRTKLKFEINEKTARIIRSELWDQ